MCWVHVNCSYLSRKLQNTKKNPKSKATPAPKPILNPTPAIWKRANEADVGLFCVEAFGKYLPLDEAPTPCTIAEITPATIPGNTYAVKHPRLSNTPFLLILFDKAQYKKEEIKLVNEPIAMGYAGLKIKSALEL